MLDEEIRFELERLNREHQWLKSVSAKYPDLCAYEYDGQKLYCSPSVNAEVDEFGCHNLIDEGLYHDVAKEANFAVSCFKAEDGGRVHSWPPMFVVGRIERLGPGHFRHLLYENWRRQLDDAGITPELVDAIAITGVGRPIEREPRDWRNGDPRHSLWTVEDRDGDTIGVFRMYERIQRDVFALVAARSESLGIRLFCHDTGFTISNTHHLQAFVDDTIAFLREREEEEDDPADARDAA